MNAENILKTAFEMSGEDMREKLAELERQAKADFLAKLPGAEDEITIKRGDFAVRVREILAKVGSPNPRGDMLALITRGMFNSMIAIALEREFFGEADTEDSGDEEE